MQVKSDAGRLHDRVVGALLLQFPTTGRGKSACHGAPEALNPKAPALPALISHHEAGEGAEGAAEQAEHVAGLRKMFRV